MWTESDKQPLTYCSPPRFRPPPLPLACGKIYRKVTLKLVGGHYEQWTSQGERPVYVRVHVCVYVSARSHVHSCVCVCECAGSTIPQGPREIHPSPVWKGRLFIVLTGLIWYPMSHLGFLVSIYIHSQFYGHTYHAG